MKIKYNGKIVAVVTIGELATIVGRKTDTLRKMEVKNQLPPPNIRGKAMENGTEGKRLYSVELAEKLKMLFTSIEQGKKIPDAIQQKISIAFQEEKLFLNTKI